MPQLLAPYKGVHELRVRRREEVLDVGRRDGRAEVSNVGQRAVDGGAQLGQEPGGAGVDEKVRAEKLLLGALAQPRRHLHARVPSTSTAVAAAAAAAAGVQARQLVLQVHVAADDVQL